MVRGEDGDQNLSQKHALTMEECHAKLRRKVATNQQINILFAASRRCAEGITSPKGSPKRTLKGTFGCDASIFEMASALCVPAVLSGERVKKVKEKGGSVNKGTSVQKCNAVPGTRGRRLFPA